MLDVATLGVFGTKKLPARRQLMDKRAHLDLCSGGFTAVAHSFEIAAIDNNFGPRDRVGFARAPAKPRHAGHTWQRFATKSQRGGRLKIRSTPDFTGSMS